MIKILNAIAYLAQEKQLLGINIDTWFNFAGTILGALIGAGIGGYVAYRVAKNQVDEQSKQVEKQLEKQAELQTKQLKEQARQQAEQMEEQAKRDMERDKTLIKNKLNLNMYLDLNKYFMTYNTKINLSNKLLTELEEGNMNLEEYNKKIEKIEISNAYNEIRVLLINIDNAIMIRKYKEINEIYLEMKNMVYFKTNDKKHEFIDTLFKSKTSNKKNEELYMLNESYLKNDMQTINNHLIKHRELIIGIIKDIQKIIKEILS